MKSILAIIVLFLVSAVTAFSLQSGDFTYEINTPDTNTVTITGYTGLGGYLNIPSTLEDKSVICIGNSAFFSITNIITCIVPDSVTSIGNQAFMRCSGMTSISIGNSVTNFGSAAFLSCHGLSEISIPDSVVSIERNAIDYCSALTNITIGAGVTNIQEGSWGFAHQCPSLLSINVDEFNPILSRKDGVLFNKNYTTIFKFPEGRTGVYTVPDSVVTVAKGAFMLANNLTSVTCGNNITSIEYAAFVSCSMLAGVYFEGDAPSVDSYAFNSSDPTIYYTSGTSGWGATFAGLTTVLWNPYIQTNDGFFGIQAEGFGFNISGYDNELVKIEACTNLSQGVWAPVSTNSLTTGTFTFYDPNWTNHLTIFYRLSMP